MILFVTRIPPNPNGHGGSQRAMHILRGLAKLDTVDLLLIHRQVDADSVHDDLHQVRGLVRTCLKVQLESWEDPQTRWPFLSWRQGRLMSLVTPYCIDAPRIATRDLQAVADQLPTRHYDAVFAGRLPCAAVAGRMLAKGLIATHRKVLDLDDIMSRFKERELEANGPTMGRLLRFLNRVDIRRLRRAERQSLRDWDVVSVCSDEDVADLKTVDPGANVISMVNVTDKAALAHSPASHPRILFVGSLRFAPNIHGLQLFMEKSWPRVREHLPSATLDVVGLFPANDLKAKLEAAGARLHANVPKVEPFYRDCDIVIAPIFFGSGTRIKIIEAMAYERTLVASTIGAEGLDIKPNVHALISDDMVDFADAVIRLARDPALRASLAANARSLQERRFSPLRIEATIAEMIGSDQGSELERMA